MRWLNLPNSPWIKSSELGLRGGGDYSTMQNRQLAPKWDRPPGLSRLYPLAPNLLTASRLALAPFAVRAILHAQFRAALAMFFVAAMTDVFDGLLARWLHVETRTGALLDPAADKILLSAVYLAMGLSGLAPWWLVALVFGRDILIVLMASAARLFTRYREFPPSVWGKLSTFLQMLAAGAVMVAGAWPVLGIRISVFLWAAAAATVWSGLAYLWRGVTMAWAARK